MLSDQPRSCFSGVGICFGPRDCTVVSAKMFLRCSSWPREFLSFFRIGFFLPCLSDFRLVGEHPLRMRKQPSLAQVYGLLICWDFVQVLDKLFSAGWCKPTLHSGSERLALLMESAFMEGSG